MSSVRVAVRVRPFNDRERDMKAKLCLKMDKTSTWIKNPETEQEKQFTFDYSYWSHDNFKIDENGVAIATNPKYASQQDVFNDIGVDILDSAFEGYNTSLFAYGQTGSGKSYSMVGYPPNRGIIPIICDVMFQRVDANQEPDTSYQVTVSMLEIYNEQVRDLLNPKINPPGGLKVRSKPGIGVYVDSLTPIPVVSYKEIEKKMSEGTRNRTIASTKMNKTSSRAHTVFTIMFTKIAKKGDAESETTSKINLVDLAGSERANSTGATGDRLKEGCAINQSLSALGNVISALADKAMGKKKVFVPYRNSVLTRLLQDALGGNSKTIMIAALSPADVNYEETLSTLRYADRAKKIKNQVVKNENPTDRIIRELKEENERLMKLLGKNGVDVGKALQNNDDEATKKLKKKLDEQMKENKRLMEQMQKSWEQKVQEAELIQNDANTGGAISANAVKGMKLPYLLNLHEDPMLSECIVYTFKNGETKIGSGRNTDVKQDIVLTGLNIASSHAIVSNDDAKVSIEPLKQTKTFVNGELLLKKRSLEHGDRVIFGSNFVFRYHAPEHENDNAAHYTWSQAMEELNKKQEERLKEAMGESLEKMEKEDAQMRHELEEKLRQMELEMKQAKEEAEKKLNDQRVLFQQKLANGTLSKEDEAALKATETQQLEAINNINDEVEKNRELTKKMAKEQSKRKRQMKKLEKELAALLPNLNEVNNMATEMNKPQTFEVRLQMNSLSATNKKTDSRNLKVMIKVTNKDDGGVWNWNTAKFENRLFMMRDYYSTWLEQGDSLHTDNVHDPFWDPPEAIDIGRAFVYLKALSQLVEIENSFTIVDYKGKEQGKLNVALHAKGPNGDELDYLDSPDEIIGEAVTFFLKLKEATNVPETYANDLFVSYSFMGTDYETNVCTTKTTNPKWNYEREFIIDNVDEELKQILLNDAIVFELHGFTDKQREQAALMGSMEVVNASAPTIVCDQCEEAQSEWECTDCSRLFCDSCYELLHKAAKKRGHARFPVDPSEYQQPQEQEAYNDEYKDDEKLNEPQLNVPICSQCEEQASYVLCVDCDRHFCPECEATLHKSKKKQLHTRVSVEQQQQQHEEVEEELQPQLSPDKPICEQCEEMNAALICTDCADKRFCDDCFALLHKAKKKRNHNRIAA